MSLAPLPGTTPKVDANYPSANPEVGKLMAKHQIKLSDPAFMPHLAYRQNLQERMGATYAPQMNNAPHVEPSAAATLSRGRLLPPSVNRTGLNFQSGALDFD
jgi:hypothetical protein